MSKSLLLALVLASQVQGATNCTTTVATWFNTTTCKQWGVDAQTQASVVLSNLQAIALNFAKCGVANYLGALTPYQVMLIPTTNALKTSGTNFVVGTCAAPTTAPTGLPTTLSPTIAPTTASPTAIAPTKNPTRNPTRNPTKLPTKNPTRNPTAPTSLSPTTKAPTKSPVRTPTVNPTLAPTVGTGPCSYAVCQGIYTNFTTAATAACKDGITLSKTAADCAGYACNAEAIAQCDGTATTLSSDFYWGFQFVLNVCNSQTIPFLTPTNCTALLPKPPAPSSSASGLAASAVSAVAVVAAMFAM
jgi:hypothetical protein